MSYSEPNNIGRLAGKRGTGLFKLHSTRPVKLFLVKKILVNVYVCELFWTTRGFAVVREGFSSGLSNLHSSCKKDFFEEKHTLWKKINLCTNVSGF